MKNSEEITFSSQALDISSTVSASTYTSSIIHKIYSVMKRSPQSVAVTDGDLQWTYEDLRLMSNKVRWALSSKGVAPGSVVGMHLPRSANAIAVMIGIMASGRVYLPLDPSYPPNRLRSMLDKAEVAAVISSDLSFELHGSDRVLLSCPAMMASETKNPTSPAQSNWGEIAQIKANDCAYIIFTSGSTGEPKGVMVTHGNISQIDAWSTEALRFTSADATATTCSFSFDPSFHETLQPLSVGATVHVISHALALGQLNKQVSLIATTPTIASALLQADQLPHLRVLLLGGEALMPDVAARLLSSGRVERLFNCYGPTECTICVSMTEVTNPVPEVISIGKQVPGTCIQLLDENGFLLPDGETGEIAIFGGQVTPGYVNDPARTAESFVTGPNGTVSAERYYRTGDLAYRTADGLIYFAGRADQQVKINGHRIELGEIDAALRSHPYVAEVATIARDGRLIAYVIPAGADDEIDVAALRAHLSAILPRFMLPAAILKIAKFPTTVNGKLDVTALPYEAMGLPAQETSSAVAFDDLTDRAVQIIGDVIGFTDQIRLSDNFIDDLGGTSLDILRVLVEFERRFGRRILINNALADTSVAGLTSLLRTQTASSSAAFAFNTDGESQPLFMIGSSLGGILGLRRVAELLPPNQPVYGLHVYPEGEQVNDKLTISTLAENAVKRIREVQPTGTIAVTGWSAGGLIAFESARILARLENSGTRVLLLDSPCPASVLDYYWGESVVYPKKVIPIALRKLRRAVVSQLPAKRRTGATTESRNLMEINEEQQEAAAAAVRRYRGEPYDGAITIMCTWQGRVMGWGRRQLGWGALPRGGVSIIGVPGSHLSLVEEPHVRTLVQKLCAWLAVD